MICAGLTDARLREASVPPSELSVLGLVPHMAEVERGWFREVLAGEDVKPIYGTDEDRDGEFKADSCPTRTPPRGATAAGRCADRGSLVRANHDSPLPRCAARTAELPRCNEPESP